MTVTITTIVMTLSKMRKKESGAESRLRTSREGRRKVRSLKMMNHCRDNRVKDQDQQEVRTRHHLKELHLNRPKDLHKPRVLLKEVRSQARDHPSQARVLPSLVRTDLLHNKPTTDPNQRRWILMTTLQTLMMGDHHLKVPHRKANLLVKAHLHPKARGRHLIKVEHLTKDRSQGDDS